MPIAGIDQISAWLAATDITELELTGPDAYLRLTQGQGGVVAATQPPAPPPPAAPEMMAVVASSVGLFLDRHPLHDVPLAIPGARVAAGQVLGLLRIGDLLLPVAAPAAGEVLAVLVPHGTVVGFGTELIRLRPLPE
jgi:acetyl-CoA carboxylase biotin carboxyl carrier protein